ncbi:MAG: 1-acyl-sn-glycerol-3-phosphate acyltransferase [Oscillospiraceae bacterium]|nr:1-acyl-sn-glycerol-3-phosphate acyltransferase [Oscillospiraceae bacterium]
MDDKKTTLIYRIIRWFVWLFSPKMTLEGADRLPDGPAVLVGNHSQMYGPIACELYLPGKHDIWCAGQMMNWKEVHAYAYEDFWSFKPRAVRWLFKLASYLITPLSVCVFNNAHTIAVYRDARLRTTFRTTIERLQAGSRVVIFPEYNRRRNNIVYDFQENFVDLARLYYKKTGEELSFIPLYIAPKLKKMVLGEPVRFRADAPIDRERRRISDCMAEAITETACAMPPHTVVPYRNISKRDYPKNAPREEYVHEETHS